MVIGMGLPKLGLSQFGVDADVLDDDKVIGDAFEIELTFVDRHQEGQRLKSKKMLLIMFL